MSKSQKRIVMSFKTTPKMKQAIEDAVKQGFYISKSELIRSAINNKLQKEVPLILKKLNSGPNKKTE